MSDIMMHGHKWDLEKSMAYCVAKVPRCPLSSPAQLLSTLDAFFKATVPG